MTGRLRSVAFAAAVIGISLAVSLVLAEVAVRLYTKVDTLAGIGFRAMDPLGAQIEPHGTYGFRQRPNATFHYMSGPDATSNSLGYRGPEVPPVPAPGTTRIIILGGSTSHGWGAADDSTIDAHMRRLLAAKYPGRSFEVVNLAFDGYDSYQDLQRLESDGLRMKPSIVIVNSGINDVRNAWFPNLKDADPRTLLWASDLERMRADQARGRPTLWTMIKHYSVLARAPGYVRAQIETKRVAAERKATAGADSAVKVPAAGGPPYPDAADYFERNVRKTVERSQSIGAAVLLSTPASALREYPDTATSKQGYWVHNAKTTQDYRDELSRRMQRIEAEQRAAGKAVRYVAPDVPKAMFLDDCHLTSEGNRRVAEMFIEAITPFLTPATTPSRPVR